MWKPRPPVAPPPAADGAPGGSDDPLPPAAVPTPAPEATWGTVLELPKEPPKKQRKVSLSGLLGKAKKETVEEEAPAPVVDELEQYLAEPAETDMDIDVLKYWAAKEKGTDKEKGWPALAKMVKQYFAAPASSAGVERVFSAAGKMHSDLQKSAKDSMLEHSLLAAFNTD